MYTIYLIANITSQKVYVGQSKSPQIRWKNHVYSLRKGIHHCQHLQRAWNKYGVDDFYFLIIETNLNEEEANLIEKNYIDWYAEIDLAYNPVWNHRGRGEVSQETREKLSKGHKEKGIKPPSRKGFSYTCTEETKKKLSEAQKGKRSLRPCPYCGKQRRERYYREKFHGYCKTCGDHRCQYKIASTPTEEQKQRLSKLRIGISPTKEAREKQSQALKGKIPKNLKEIQKLRAKVFKLISPSGEKIEATNINLFCRQNNLEPHRLGKLINGYIAQYRGWTKD